MSQVQILSFRPSRDVCRTAIKRLFSFPVRFQSLTYATHTKSCFAFGECCIPTKKATKPLWFGCFFCLVCQFETVRVANAGSHTTGITERSVVTLSDHLGLWEVIPKPFFLCLQRCRYQGSIEKAVSRGSPLLGC